MPPKVPRLRWDDPLRALDVLGSLWSSTGLPSVTSVSAQAVAVPYRTLFTTLQQLLVGKRITIRMGDHDVTLTVTELDSELEPRALAVGQLGEVRVAARDIEWGQQRLQRAVAVLRNVHIRPGVPPLVVAAPVELSTALPAEIFDEMVRQAAPQLHAQLLRKLVVLAPHRQPFLQQLLRHLGLHQMLMLGRALAHRLGGRRAAGGRGERGIAARPADEGLRCAVGRLNQTEFALQACERKHAVLFERGGEFLGGEAVDLVAAVGDEVEDEAEFAEFFGEAAHLLVAHSGGIPAE